MMKYLLVLLVALITATESLKIPEDLPNIGLDSIKNVVKDVEEALGKIPIESRKAFVKYNFAQALLQKAKFKPQLMTSRLVEEILTKKVEEYETEFPNQKSMDPSIAMKVLEIAQAEYKLDDDAISDYVVFNSICFPTGCVDPGDVGSLCCPFKIKKD